MSTIKWCIFLILIAVSCYLREIVFLSINQYLSGGELFYASTFEIPKLESFNNGELIKLKVFLTILFTLLISGLTIAGCKSIFSSKFAYQLSIATYIVIAISCVLISSTLFIVGNRSQIYPSLRFVIEYLHSPLLFIFFSVANYSIPKSINSNKS